MRLTVFLRDIGVKLDVMLNLPQTEVDVRVYDMDVRVFCRKTRRIQWEMNTWPQVPTVHVHEAEGGAV